MIKILGGLFIIVFSLAAWCGIVENSSYNEQVLRTDNLVIRIIPNAEYINKPNWPLSHSRMVDEAKYAVNISRIQATDAPSFDIYIQGSNKEFFKKRCSTLLNRCDFGVSLPNSKISDGVVILYLLNGGKGKRFNIKFPYKRELSFGIVDAISGV